MIIACPKCGKKTALQNDTCEHCKTKFKKCPECENVLQVDESVCDYCGFSFDAIQKEKSASQSIPTDLKKKAAKLASFAELENKKYHRIAKFLSPIGFVFLFLAIALPTILLLGKNLKLSKIQTADKLCTACLVISSICIFGASIFKEFRTLFSANAIARQMQTIGFNYKLYYSYEKAGRNLLTSLALEDCGEVQLVQAIRYQEDSSAKIVKLFKRLCIVTCILLFCIFISIGLRQINDILLVTKLLGTSYKFKISAHLIIGLLFYILSFVLDLFLDKDTEEATQWIDQTKRGQ